MSLSASLQVSNRSVVVDIDVPTGSTLGVIGPNGAGKSTVLEALAGLVGPDRGHARVDARRLFDTAAGIDVPPHRRGVALLAQDPCLFPRMSVLGNVAFSVRARGGDDPRGTARRWLRAVQADAWEHRRPSELSGGQAQRVAMARALAAEPALLLLDEPLAALDQPVAAQIRQSLREILHDRTAILVTHEILDVALLCDRVAVMQDGRIVEQGATEQVLHHPRTPFAAQVCGLNLLAGHASGPDTLNGALGEVAGVIAAPLPAGPAVATFRPASVSVHRRRPDGSPRNVFSAAVEEIVPQGQLVRVRAGGIAADITPAAVAALRLTTGTEVFLAVKAAEVSLYPA